MKVASCLTAGLMILISFAAQATSHDQTKAYVTTTIVKPSQSASGSDEFASGTVVTTSKKIITMTQAQLVGASDLGLGDTVPPGGVLPGGGTLPTTGVPGQTVTIDTCVPRHSTVEYEFKWVPAPPPGHWEVILKKLTEVASTQCT
ncbi:MAG: hypothetical protein ACREPN_02220 [Rudaea sp.]